VFGLRARTDDAGWSRVERFVRIGFWGLNAGLALMIVLDLFPAGVLQLWEVITHGYWHARRLDWALAGTFHPLEWIRMAGDLTFIPGGAVPVARVVATAGHWRLQAD
jgi:nitric oxide reductase subunit B